MSPKTQKEQTFGGISGKIAGISRKSSGRANRAKKKQINVNKFGALSRHCGCQNVIYVLFGVIPYGVEKAHRQHLQKIPGQSRDFFVDMFFIQWVFHPKQKA